jgi:excisionase family DNA binding protein
MTTAKEYCSTSEAALMLGVSVATVQKMVETGDLEAWKTKGGHRRVKMLSVERYIGHNSGIATPATGADEPLTVLVAEDDVALQVLYQRTMESWDIPINTVVVGDGFEALMRIGRAKPDLLIVDLQMEKMDGFELVRSLRADDSIDAMDIVVVSGLTPEQIEKRGGIPHDIAVFGKPVPFDELRGYLRAKIAEKRRRGFSA